jgi:short-subunit dehydrogenase
MKELRGKNALLTGGSRGIGPYIARRLAERGVNVALAARSESALRSVADDLAGSGVRTAILPVDVGDVAARDDLPERAVAALGPIDILINNAGVEWIYSYVKLAPDDIERMVRVNLIAPMILTRLMLPGMIERGVGQVINMASMGGKKGNPYSATYAGTKAALIEWTGAVRAELQGTGVSASVVCPGFIKDQGMFAELGISAPRIAGESTPEQVAEGTMRALEGDLAEVIVNPGPVKLMLVLNAISPRLATWAYRSIGVHGMYRKQAKRHESEPEERGPR